jgi:hypothetical protein
MRLVIHGGIHRTGTTTLQRSLATDREFLLKQGVVYPFDDDNHQSLCWELRSNRRSGPELLEQLKAETRGVKATTILLSGEDFCTHKDLGWLEPLRQEYDTEVHFYLRRQDLWLMSWYNQHVKWPFDRVKSKLSAIQFLDTIDDYYWLDYYWLAQNWSSALGKENVYLHIFEYDIDIVSDFCQVLGIETRDISDIPVTQNSSLPAEILEFVRHFDLYSFRPKQRMRFLEAIREICKVQRLKGSNVYSPAVRNLILARFAETNRLTATEFLSRESGKLFADAEVSRTEPYASAQLPESGELMKRYVIPLVRAMVTANRKQ